MSVHEFYRLKMLITLEQVNSTEWSKKIRILISKTAMVGYVNFPCMQMGLVISTRFIFIIINNLFIYSALFNMLGDQKCITTINNLKTINTNIRNIQMYLISKRY